MAAQLGKMDELQKSSQQNVVPDHPVHPVLILDVGRAIHSAFSEIGFVFVTNHGVPSATVRDLFASSKRFFELGRDAKEACPMTMMGGKACQVQEHDHTVLGNPSFAIFCRLFFGKFP